MGAYLAKPKTEKISEGSENGQVSYGVSCMQGWRVTMEDAHTCMLDFDNSSTLFAVYDGHGGAEVAQYVSKHLPDVLKNTETYKKGEVKQSLIDSFLEVDQHIITDEGLTELKELAGVDKDLDEDEDLGLLEQEASMPLHELLAKMKEMKRLLSANSGEEESVEYWTENNEQDTGDDDDDDDDEEKNENKEQSNHVDSQNKNDSKNGKEEKKDNENGSKNEDRSSLSNMNSTSESAKDDKEKEKKDTDNENKNDEKPQQEEAESSQGEKVEGNNQINVKNPGPEDEKDDEDEEEEEDDEDEDDEDDDDDDDDDDEDEQDGDGSEGFQSSDEVGYDSGTTAIVALLHKNQLTVANVGDSRCVLCRNGIALEMSMDHKPEDEHEMNRIHKAGGKVTCDGRVNGGLNLSRALGDHSYKLQTDLSAHEQQITALPDVRQTQLTEADEFMVIACDGIWNVKGSQEVVDFVADRLREQRENDMFNLENICEELLDSCLAPDTSGDGSGCDNMTSIIVVFNAAESDTATDHNNKKRKLQQDAETPDGDAADKKIKTDQNS